MYADMVRYADKLVGDLVRTLDELNHAVDIVEDENIAFLSDQFGPILGIHQGHFAVVAGVLPEDNRSRFRATRCQK